MLFQETHKVIPMVEYNGGTFGEVAKTRIFHGEQFDRFTHLSHILLEKTVTVPRFLYVVRAKQV